jgi:hypothetical protein
VWYDFCSGVSDYVCCYLVQSWRTVSNNGLCPCGISLESVFPVPSCLMTFVVLAIVPCVRPLFDIYIYIYIYLYISQVVIAVSNDI